ncbi:MAG: cache domain-containing protein [Deltaproteobacteria bacterium]|nr:cache domain-containing protein [Deltaproteobacteria bacterium]
MPEPTPPGAKNKASEREDSGFSLRLVLPSVLTIVLFTIALFVVILPTLEKSFVDRKRETIRELTRVAWDTLAYYYGQEKAGHLTRQQAQSRAIEQLREMRYGRDGKDYFWINDLGPIMIMHPYRPDLEGKNVSGFTDPHGKHLFSEMVDVVKKEGRGYVDYMWQWKDDPLRIVPKVSFVREFAPWGWVVGTGIYVEDVSHEISAITGRLTAVGLAILSLVALLEFYMVHQSLVADGQRRQAEDELRHSRAMLRLVMDNIPQLIFWKDREGSYLGCNRAFAAHLGLDSAEKIRGRADRDLPWFHADRGGMRALENRVMSSGASELHVIEPQTLPDGTPSWMDINRIPLRDDEGRVVGILCTYEDITQRRETTQALRESERRFRALVENVQVGIAIVQRGSIVYANPEQERILGPLELPFPLSRLRGAASPELHRLLDLAENPVDQPESTLDLDLGFAPAGDSAAGWPVRWVHCRTRRIAFQGEDALLIIMLDITKAKELEQLVRIQDKMASLGRVAAGIAHEIRNPLSGINMYLSALENRLDTGQGPEVSTIVEKIKAASTKIEGVIKRVLDFAKPSQPKLSWLNLNRVVTNVVELSSVTLRKSGITLETHLAPHLPLVHVDAGLLEQVLLNLMTNAVQALADAPGEKKIGLASSLEGNRIIIRVSDSGPGVPAEIRDRVFDPFFTGKRDGSGIGLSLSHRIVSDHGGVLSVNTSRWGGAEFTMEIPAAIYWGYDSHG